MTENELKHIEIRNVLNGIDHVKIKNLVKKINKSDIGHFIILSFLSKCGFTRKIDNRYGEYVSKTIDKNKIDIFTQRFEFENTGNKCFKLIIYLIDKDKNEYDKNDIYCISDIEDFIINFNKSVFNSAYEHINKVYN
jgi:hypothetical protein